MRLFLIKSLIEDIKYTSLLINLLDIILIERENVYKVFFRRIQSMNIYYILIFVRDNLIARSSIDKYLINSYLFVTRF